MIEEEPNNLEKKPEQKKEKRKYNLKSSGFRQRIEQNLDKNSRIIKKLKNTTTILTRNYVISS